MSSTPTDIEKADKIVFGDENFICSLVANKVRVDPNALRRGAYAEWFSNRIGLHWPTPSETLESQAKRIVRLDAEERRTKQPDDGLPPGPWKDGLMGIIYDANGVSLAKGDGGIVASYLARCGSPAVRRLLAAYDVTEERVNDNSRALVRYPSGVAETFFIPSLTREILCWLTPRSKQ